MAEMAFPGEPVEELPVVYSADWVRILRGRCVLREMKREVLTVAGGGKVLREMATKETDDAPAD